MYEHRWVQQGHPLIFYREEEELTVLREQLEKRYEAETETQDGEGSSSTPPAASSKPRLWPQGCTACSKLQAAEAENLEKFR